MNQRATSFEKRFEVNFEVSANLLSKTDLVDFVVEQGALLDGYRFIFFFVDDQLKLIRSLVFKPGAVRELLSNLSLIVIIGLEIKAAGILMVQACPSANSFQNKGVETFLKLKEICREKEIEMVDLLVVDGGSSLELQSE
jgi:hypothetical protein